MISASVPKPATTRTPNSSSRPSPGKQADVLAGQAAQREQHRLLGQREQHAEPDQPDRPGAQQHHRAVEQLTGGERTQRQGTRTGEIGHGGSPGLTGPHGDT